MFHHTPVLVLVLGIGIGIGQYYWVLGAFFGIVLTLGINSQLANVDSGMWHECLAVYQPLSQMPPADGLAYTMTETAMKM